MAGVGFMVGRVDDRCSTHFETIAQGEGGMIEIARRNPPTAEVKGAFDKVMEANRRPKLCQGTARTPKSDVHNPLLTPCGASPVRGDAVAPAGQQDPQPVAAYM